MGIGTGRLGTKPFHESYLRVFDKDQSGAFDMLQLTNMLTMGPEAIDAEEVSQFLSFLQERTIHVTFAVVSKSYFIILFSSLKVFRE